MTGGGALARDTRTVCSELSELSAVACPNYARQVAELSRAGVGYATWNTTIRQTWYDAGNGAVGGWTTSPALGAQAVRTPTPRRVARVVVSRGVGAAVDRAEHVAFVPLRPRRRRLRPHPAARPGTVGARGAIRRLSYQEFPADVLGDGRSA